MQIVYDYVFIWLYTTLLDRYEVQRDILYNQAFNIDQVASASEGAKDAQQTVCYKRAFNFFL